MKYVDSATAERHAVYIIDEVASQWRKIGALLNCEDYDLQNIAENNASVEDRCRAMFTQWCKGRIGDEPHTWARLIDAMHDARCGTISSKVKTIFFGSRYVVRNIMTDVDINFCHTGEWEYYDQKSCSIM